MQKFGLQDKTEKAQLVIHATICRETVQNVSETSLHTAGDKTLLLDMMI